MNTKQAVKHIEQIREETEKKIACLPPMMRDRTSLNSVAKALKMAVDALKDQDNNRWIPVSERLPKGFGTFLVTIDEVHGENRHSVDAADFDPFEKTWTTSNYFCAGYKVTHWKPLPEPWKGDGK